jgi:hypothetical protein
MPYFWEVFIICKHGISFYRVISTTSRCFAAKTAPQKTSISARWQDKGSCFAEMSGIQE